MVLNGKISFQKIVNSCGRFETEITNLRHAKRLWWIVIENAVDFYVKELKYEIVNRQYCMGQCIKFVCHFLKILQGEWNIK